MIKTRNDALCFMYISLFLLVTILLSSGLQFTTALITFVPIYCILRTIIHKNEGLMWISVLVLYLIALMLHMNYLYIISFSSFSAVGICIGSTISIGKSNLNRKPLYIFSILIITCATIYFDFVPIKHSVISDSGLRSTAKRTLKIINQPFTENNLKEIKTFDYPVKFIRNLDDIHKIKNLEFIAIERGFMLKDYTPLSKLPKLDGMRIKNDKTSHINSSVPLVTLHRIILEDCKIDAPIYLNVFSNVKNFEVLDSKLKDFTFIKNIKTIDKIWIYNCDISSFTGLSELPNLKEIDFSSCKFPEDKSELENLAGVKVTYD